VLFFYIHGFVHRESNLVFVQQDATLFSLLYRVIRNNRPGFNNLPPRSPDATPCDFFLWGLRQGSGLSSYSSRKYSGTEGTNQNRH